MNQNRSASIQIWLEVPAPGYHLHLISENSMIKDESIGPIVLPIQKPKLIFGEEVQSILELSREEVSESEDLEAGLPRVEALAEVKKATWSKRILIVDDEPFNLIGLKFLLQSYFTSEVDFDSYIDEASNGAEAVEMVKAGLASGDFYGLVFMDCSMPILNGYDATRQIRELVESH